MDKGRLGAAEEVKNWCEGGMEVITRIPKQISEGERGKCLGGVRK